MSYTTEYKNDFHKIAFESGINSLHQSSEHFSWGSAAESFSWETASAFEAGFVLGSSLDFFTDISITKGRTYFVAGAGFKPDGEIEGFTKNFIDKGKKISGDDFYVVQSSPMGGPRFIQAPYSGRWAIVNSSSIIDVSEYNRRYGNIRRTVDEIVNDYTINGGVENGKQTQLLLNLVGSSYGSAVVAQTAINILEENNNITKLGVVYLRASMVHPDSALGVALKDLVSYQKIAYLDFDNNPNDNIVGAGGMSKKEGRKNFRKVTFGTRPSIINLEKHPHNIDAKDPNEKESNEAIQKLFIENNAAGENATQKAQEILDQNK